MTPDGIATLVLSILAVVISVFTICFTYYQEKVKARSEYRSMFYISVLKNDNLVELAKTISDLEKKSVSSDSLQKIHTLSAKYRKDLKYLSFCGDFFKTIDDLIITIDDASINALQKKHDDEDFDEYLENIKSTIKIVFDKYEEFFLGK